MSSQYELIGGEAQKANIIAKCAEQGLCNSRVSVRPSVCPIDRQQQRCAASLPLSVGDCDMQMRIAGAQQQTRVSRGHMRGAGASVTRRACVRCCKMSGGGEACRRRSTSWSAPTRRRRTSSPVRRRATRTTTSPRRAVTTATSYTTSPTNWCDASVTKLSMCWVDPWVGLGRVGSRFFLVFGGLGWVTRNGPMDNPAPECFLQMLTTMRMRVLLLLQL